MKSSQCKVSWMTSDMHAKSSNSRYFHHFCDYYTKSETICLVNKFTSNQISKSPVITWSVGDIQCLHKISRLACQYLHAKHFNDMHGSTATGVTIASKATLTAEVCYLSLLSMFCPWRISVSFEILRICVCMIDIWSCGSPNFKFYAA